MHIFVGDTVMPDSMDGLLRYDFAQHQGGGGGGIGYEIDRQGAEMWAMKRLKSCYMWNHAHITDPLGADFATSTHRASVMRRVYPTSF